MDRRVQVAQVRPEHVGHLLVLGIDPLHEFQHPVGLRGREGGERDELLFGAVNEGLRRPDDVAGVGQNHGLRQGDLVENPPLPEHGGKPQAGPVAGVDQDALPRLQVRNDRVEERLVPEGGHGQHDQVHAPNGLPGVGGHHVKFGKTGFVRLRIARQLDAPPLADGFQGLLEVRQLEQVHLASHERQVGGDGGAATSGTANGYF